jgi:hypothetical protein
VLKSFGRPRGSPHQVQTPLRKGSTDFNDAKSVTAARTETWPQQVRHTRPIDRLRDSAPRLPPSPPVVDGDGVVSRDCRDKPTTWRGAPERRT